VTVTVNGQTAQIPVPEPKRTGKEKNMKTQTIQGMKTISRHHLFENRITLVRQGEWAYYIHHEKDDNSLMVKRTPELEKAFEAENWDAFEAAEAQELGGEVAEQVAP
jgi:hypothetical protein